MLAELGEPLRAPLAWHHDHQNETPLKRRAKSLLKWVNSISKRGKTRIKSKLGLKKNKKRVSTWRTFRQVSVSGIDATMDKRSPLLRRALWACLLLVCTSLMIAQCSDRVIHYMGENVNVNVRVKHNDSLEFPALTLCNKNPFNLTAALHLAIKHGILPVDANEAKVNVSLLLGVEGMTVSDLWEKLAHKREDYVQECWYKRNVVCEEAGSWKRVHTVIGPCLTYTLNKSTINTVGSFASLYMRLQDSTPPAPKGETGVRILMHHGHTSPILTMRTHSIAAELGWSRDVKMELRKFRTLDTKSSPCIEDVSYSTEHCNLECFQHGLSGYSKCRMPFMLQEDSVRECSSAAEYEAGLNAVTEMLLFSGWTVADCQCENECVKTTFQAYPNNLGYKTNQTRLRFFYSDLVYEDISEEWAYTTISLLCDIGGTLGLLMGASVLTVCEIIEVAWSKFLQRCCRLQDRKPPPASSKKRPQPIQYDPDTLQALSKLRHPVLVETDNPWGSTPSPQLFNKTSLTYRNLKLSKPIIQPPVYDF